MNDTNNKPYINNTYKIDNFYEYSWKLTNIDFVLDNS